MKIIGIIPARGGSKRLPKKNLADLGGKPLVQWSIESALESKVFDKLFVSTEDEEIGEIAGEFWWKRDPLLAQDSTPTLPVIIDVFEHNQADIVFTLQATSPFRTAKDIKNVLELMFNTNADAVISVTRGPEDLAFEIGHARRLRSVPNILIPNGAIYAIKGECLARGESWYDGLLYGYEMPKERSLDIDNGMDLQIANHMIKLFDKA